MGRPSKQQLDTVFGTHNDTDVVTQILEKGDMQAASEWGRGKGRVTRSLRLPPLSEQGRLFYDQRLQARPERLVDGRLGWRSLMGRL